MMFLGGTNNLLMIYLGIEFLGLISYIIAAYWRGNLKSSESGLKYFLIGTASSITMLYGISLLYGVTGSLDLGEINALFVKRQRESRGAFHNYPDHIDWFGF